MYLMRYCSWIKILPYILTLFICSIANGRLPEQGHGSVSMQGSIIESACAISTTDLEQTIDMGVTTVGEIIRDTNVPRRNFSLHLINCDLSSDSADQKPTSEFQITFDGPTKDGIFSVTGASGIGLQIIDASGYAAIPGQSMPRAILKTGTQQLDYTLRLMGNHERLKAGKYYTILRFKIDYF